MSGEGRPFAAESALTLRGKTLLAEVCGHSFLGGVLTPDAVVFDLGANRGEFAHEVHRRFGCRVHAVEPSPELAAGLRGCAWLKVEQAAVSGRPGTARFLLDENAEASRLDSGGGSADVGTRRHVDVAAVTLDQVLGAAEGPVDLVKMDIEGGELDALETASEPALRRIRQLTVEFHQFLDPRMRPRVEAVKRRLKRLGFWSLDFSRLNYDVLFARYELGLNGWVRFRLRTHKYKAGLARRLGPDGRARCSTGAGSIARSPTP